MDFELSKEEKAFKQEVIEFCETELTEADADEYVNSGPLASWILPILPKLGKRGWLGLDWSKEYGGSGGTVMQKYILTDELAYHMGPIFIAPNVAAPIILLFGTEAQKKKWLPPIARGEIEFALGYTEPQAGSDLASLEIRAVEERDCYIITGQKMFNSSCHYADYHWLGARTDWAPKTPKKKGISLFIVDLKSKGITIRPLWNMAGFRTNEVFYDNVRVPKENLIGQKNRGFYHMSAALDLERLFPTGDLRRNLEELVQYVKETKRNDERLANGPQIRYRLAETAIEVKAAHLLADKVAWMYHSGKTPVYESNVSKVFGDELRKRVMNLGMQILGPYGLLKKGSKWVQLDGKWNSYYQTSFLLTLAGGTSEILRTVIATRGLELPRE